MIKSWQAIFLALITMFVCISMWAAWLYANNAIDNVLTGSCETMFFGLYEVCQ